MDKILTVIIIDFINNKEQTAQCLSTIKAQKCEFGKGLMVGGDYTKSELLNKGLSLCQTPYLMFVETTQRLKLDYIKKCFDAIQKYPVGAVYTDFENEYYRQYLPSFDRQKITSGHQIPTTALYKREVFETCGEFDVSLSVLENWDMWLRISEKFPIFHIPESLYVSCKKDINITNKTLNSNRDYILSKARQRTNG
jgi:hypothetical protein